MYVSEPATTAVHREWPSAAACPPLRRLGPQHHLVAHHKGRVHPAQVQRRLALLLRSVQLRPHLLLQSLRPSSVGRLWLPGSPQVRKRQLEAGMLASITARSPGITRVGRGSSGSVP